LNGAIVNIADPGRTKSVAVIVAHPDDEALWAGGTILSHPSWKWHIVTVCRASDADRAPRFYRAVQALGATGNMADLDDEPEQTPLDPSAVQGTILDLLPLGHFDLILSHNPSGEYTRHLRHEETAAAVISLWHSGKLAADKLWTFAYHDGARSHLPRAVKSASIYYLLSDEIWQQKYRIITGTYGFSPGGFEAQTTPRAEAFWRFTIPSDAQAWLERGGVPS
jgi:LmbE family N-acetylglucosaminyl deacetylase